MRHYPNFPERQRRVLVQGNLPEPDGGNPATPGDARLLREVRQARPTAFILYKAHPEAEFHGATGGLTREEALADADALAENVWQGALFPHLDEIHVTDSLAGFEALLYGVDVYTYGRPWYAGWGLTRDRESLNRPRSLSLDELIAGALILYPRYYDWTSGHICTPEDLLHRMEHPGETRPKKTDPLVILWEAYRRIALKILFR